MGKLAKYEKIWKKITAVPYRSDIRISELELILKAAGFNLVRQSGSRMHYRHKEHQRLITIPNPSKGDCPLPAYIKLVHDTMIELGIDL